MINLLLGLSILATLISTNWTTVKIDSTLTVQLPDNFFKVDTLGQTIFSGRTESSFVSVCVSKPSYIFSYYKKKELIDSYDNLVEGFLGTFKDAKLLSKSIYDIDGVTSMKVEFQYNNGGTLFYVNSVFSLVNETSYCLMTISERLTDCKVDLRQLTESINFKI